MLILSSRTWLLAIILCLLLPLCGCSSPPSTARVTQVIDGDTIVIEGNYRVRYIGIDTPEVHPQLEAYGIEAWQVNRRLVEGKRVRLERDVSETDPYGRLLRYVYVDSIFVNAKLVREGLARTKAYPLILNTRTTWSKSNPRPERPAWGYGQNKRKPR